MRIEGINLLSVFHTIHLLAESHLNNFPVKSRMQFISISISIISISKTVCRFCNLSFASSLSGYLDSIQRLCHCQWIRDLKKKKKCFVAVVVVCACVFFFGGGVGWGIYKHGTLLKF